MWSLFNKYYIVKPFLNLIIDKVRNYNFKKTNTYKKKAYTENY